MRIAFCASLCVALFACGQGGSLSGNSRKQTADSRGSRSGESTKSTKSKSDAKSEDSASNDPDDSNNDDSRVVAPEVITGAYLTCTAAVTTSQPAPEGKKYFGCIAVDAQRNRIDLKHVDVAFVLKDLQGNALAIDKVSLADADQDVVWAVPFEIYQAGISPEASFPGSSSGDGAVTTIQRKCFMKVKTSQKEEQQEAQCQAPT